MKSKFLRICAVILVGIIMAAFSVMICRNQLVKAWNMFVPKKPLCKDCNILLISLDTCGASHMSTYGYARDTTPNLTALANEGVLFQNNHANANWTLPSHVSIFTGLYPFVHNIKLEDSTYLDLSVALLPEVLQKNGYETYFYAPKQEANIPPVHVYNRGIAHWDDNYWDYRTMEKEYFTGALNQLTTNFQKNKKTFMFYHTYACHSPYTTDDQPLLYTEKSIASLPLKDGDIFNAPFTESYYRFLLSRLPKGIHDGDFHIAPEKMKDLLQQLQTASDFGEATRIYTEASVSGFWGDTKMMDYQEDFRYWSKIDAKNEKDMQYIQALYDQGIHTVDDAIFATLKDVWKNAPWNKNTLVVITADHGEEFMEHGYLSHITLYDYNTHVPLVLLLPEISKKVIRDHVQSVDLMPTILDVIGIKNSIPFNGISIAPLISGGKIPDRLILAEGHAESQPDLLTIREGDWKLFVHKGAGDIYMPYELFNTKDDMAEQTNVLSQYMKRANMMIEKYRKLKQGAFIVR